MPTMSAEKAFSAPMSFNDVEFPLQTAHKAKLTTAPVFDLGGNHNMAFMPEVFGG